MFRLGGRLGCRGGLCDEHRRVLQADEGVGLSGGQDEHLTGPEFARGPRAVNVIQPSRHWMRTSPAISWWWQTSLPGSKIRRMTSSVRVFTRVDVCVVARVGPRGRTSITSPDFACGIAMRHLLRAFRPDRRPER